LIDEAVIFSASMSDGQRTLVVAILNLCYAWILIQSAVAPSVPAAGEWFPDKPVLVSTFLGYLRFSRQIAVS